MAFEWLDQPVVEALHDEILAEHGGQTGVRDADLLALTISRPRALAAYELLDAADIAASYALGFLRNRPFIGGNRRTAFAAAALFMELNGLELTAPDREAIEMTLALDGGLITASDYAGWLGKKSRAIAASKAAGPGSVRAP